MTIMQKYYNQYKEHSLKEFWDWWSDKNSAIVMVMEIRLLVGIKKVDYSWLKNFAYANKLIFSGFRAVNVLWWSIITIVIVAIWPLLLVIDWVYWLVKKS